MLRDITSFRGEAPRVTPRALPDNAAQEALNASLLTGDLRAFRQFATTLGLANPGVVRTIYLLNGAWLSWESVVDVARGTVAGDTTFRTYLTSPDFYGEPRFTTYAMATTGSMPYPVTTRPLGVPPPDTPPALVLGVDTTPTTYSTDVLDTGGVLATNWTKSPTVNGGGIRSEVLQTAIVGNPQPSYEIVYENNDGNAAWLYRNFGIAAAAAVRFSTDFQFRHGSGGYQQMLAHVMNSVDGNDLTAGYDSASGNLSIILAAGWTSRSGSALASTAAGALSFTVWYTLTVDVVVNADGTQTVTAGLYLGSGQIATVTATNAFTLGDYCGFVAETSFSDPSDEFQTYYDNVYVLASGSTNYTPTTLATSYVFTFVNDLGEESAPSPASATVLRPDGVSVTVTTPVAVPSGVSSDYGVTTKRIYRAATGNAGTEFRFIAEIPIGTADYVDVLTDAQLGEVLPSSIWALPPDDLENILALPNGVMAGFAKNQLCLSARNQPHAWPVEYRLNTDTDIIGIGNVDTTVVIGTESFVYIASGNDPAAYSMNKFEVPYACVSKRSFAYLTGIGVVFAGPDGLMAVAGIGQVRNLTDSVFTRDQWQALNPSSIVASAHNDIYWMHWESGSQRGCYAIDMKATGFGVVQMAFHATAPYVDPVEDKMYLVLDADDEPDDDLLPVRADPPHYVDGRTIYEFEGNAAVLMTYRYRSKLWLLGHPAWFTIFQVKAEDYDNILLRIYGDGVQIDEIVVEGETEFTLSEVDEAYTSLEYEVLGTSAVRVLQGAEDVAELT